METGKPLQNGAKPGRFYRRGRPWVVLAAVVSVTAGCLLWLWRVPEHGYAAPADQPVRDVPSVQGKTIVFSPAFGKRVGVQFGLASEAQLVPRIQVVGTVAFDASRQAAVGTRSRGLVRRVFHTPGDDVKVGDALAEVESAELGEAQANLASAEAQLHAAVLEERRESALAQNSLTTAREVEAARSALAQKQAEARAARQRVKTLEGGASSGFGVQTLRAPISGSIIERTVSPGQTVEPSVVAFRIADLRGLWIELHVFERDLASVKEGDLVELSPLAERSRKIQGRVARVGKTIDEGTRSSEIRVTVDNPGGALRPGQSVEATIHATSGASRGLAVPESAITYVDGHPVVFVAETETRLIPAEIELGRSDGTQRQVLSGLRVGQKILIDGVFALKSELFR